jgi:hypothetical protein
MAVAYDQSESRNARREQRYADQEARTVQAVEAELRRKMLLALDSELHDYFRPRQIPTELVYQGKMNEPVEFSDCVTGCELTDPFTAWLQSHQLIDAEEAARRNKIRLAFARLLASDPYAYRVVVEHARTGDKLIYLSRQWRHGNHRVNDAYSEGLGLMLEYLGAA